MGVAAQVITAAHKTVAEKTIEEMAAVAGDSLSIANFPFESPAYLDQVWVAGTKPEEIRIRSPRLHDMAQGIRLGVPAQNIGLLPPGVQQELYPGDTLIAEIADTEKEKTDALSMVVYYSDLPGIAARLATWDEIKGRIGNIAGDLVKPKGSATLSGYGAGVTLLSQFDTLKSGIDYAILGYECRVACTVFAIVGPDTGNLRIGGPGPLEPQVTRDWFVRLSVTTQRPFIPIINSLNAAATLAVVSTLASETEVPTTLILAELH